MYANMFSFSSQSKFPYDPVKLQREVVLFTQLFKNCGANMIAMGDGCP